MLGNLVAAAEFIARPLPNTKLNHWLTPPCRRSPHSERRRPDLHPRHYAVWPCELFNWRPHRRASNFEASK
jgi:hypothetical protein